MQISYLVKTEQMINYLSGQGMTAPSNIYYENNLKQYRLAAHKKICGHLGYEILDTTYTNEMYSSNGGFFLYLNNRPVTSLDDIKLNGVTLDKTNYSIIDGKYLYCESGFTRGFNCYSISYKAGWTESTLPADIRQAALDLIALYNGRNGGGGTTIGKTSISIGNGGSESIDPDAEERILKGINHYARYDKF